MPARSNVAVMKLLGAGRRTGSPAQQPHPVIAAGSRRGGQARAGDLGGKGSGAGFNPGRMLPARAANRCLAHTTGTAITFGADSVPGVTQGG